MSIVIRACFLAVLLTCFSAVGGEPKENERETLQTIEQRIKRIIAEGPEARDSVPWLIRQLADERPIDDEPAIFTRTVHYQAAEALVAIGSEAVGELINGLNGGSAEVQKRIVVVLARLGPKGRPAAPALVKWGWHDPNADKRSDVIWALGCIESIEKIPVLLEGLNDRNDKVRTSAAAALGNFPADTSQSVAPLVLGLKDPVPDVRAACAKSLGDLHTSPQVVVPALMALLSDTELFWTGVADVGWQEPDCQSAARALARFGVDSRPAAATLLARFFEAKADDLPLTCFADALKPFADLVEPQAERLAKLLLQSRENGSLRREVPTLLNQLGPRAVSALPVLRQVLQTSDSEEFRVRIALVVLQIDGGKNQNTTEWNILQKSLEGMCERAATDHYELHQTLIPRLVAVSRLPSGARFALPMLRKLATDHSGDFEIAGALARLEPNPRPALAIVIEHLAYFYLRDDAFDVLQSLGPVAVEELTAALKRSSREREVDEVLGIVDALKRLGLQSSPALPVLLELLNHPQGEVRTAAAEAVGVIRADPPRAVQGLLPLLTDPRPAVREQAALSLGALGKASVPALPQLITTLQDDYIDVRIASARALGDLHPVSRSAVPALRAALRDANSEVRRHATVALAKFR